MRRRLPLLAFVFVSTIAWRSLASGSDVEAWISKGIELREAGRDDEALSLFKKAFAASPSPRAQAQVGLAEQALGMWVAAEKDLVAALSAERDPWIQKNRAALEGALGVIQRHVGGLEVRGADGAEVLVDGVVAGRASSQASFRVPSGTRTLTLRTDGYHDVTRTIEVPPGGIARETVTLVAVSREEGVPTAPPPRGGEAGDGGDRGAAQRIVGWSSAGLGAALLATGAVGFVIRDGIVQDYNESCPGLGAAQPAGCDVKVESQRTWLTVSIVSLVAGGVFALGGLTLVLTAPRAASAKAEAGSVRCTPFGCAGTF